MARTTLAIPPALRDRLDRYVKVAGYATRTEAVCAALREWVAKQEKKYPHVEGKEKAVS